MADEKKELILSVGFDLDRAEERKLKANLDKATGELEKQQREAKQLSQTLDELNKKYAALNEQHEKKRFRKAELERTYQEQEAKMKAGDRSAAEWMFSGEGTKTKEEIAALAAEMKPLESELDEVNAKIGETEKKLGDVNAKINVTTANVEVAREKLKKAHIPKSIKESANELDRFGKRIKGLVKQAFIFGVIAKGLRTMVGYMGELLKSTPEYAEQLSQIKGNLMVTASSLWTALEPAISWLLSALNYLTQVLAVGVSTMLGQTREEAIEAAKAFDGLTKSSKKSTASLDTLHKLGDSSIMASYEVLENIDEDKWAELAETFNFILRIVRSIGTALLIWKIASSVLGFFSDLKTLGFKNGMLALQLTLAADLIWDGIKDLTDDITDNDLMGMIKTALGSALGLTSVAKLFGVSTGVALKFSIPASLILTGTIGYAFSSERKEAAEKIDDIFEQIDEKYEDKEDNFVNKVDKFNEKTGTALMESLIGFADWLTGTMYDIQKIDPIRALINGIAGKDVYENKWFEKETQDSQSETKSTEGLTQSNEDLTDAVAAATAAMERLNSLTALSVPHIPKLATGTIIPPNNPYLAVVGDQRSGTNVEAPLETIVEAMQIALREQGTGYRNMEVVMELDGRELGRTFVQVYDEEKQRVGVRLAKA